MKFLYALMLALLSLSAHAAQAPLMAENEAVERRLIAISEELRCLVCQNESLAGSRADLAQDLRREIRNLIKEGKSDQEVIDFLVSRYGDFVRYRPPFKPTTWLLWLGPFVLMVAGLGGLVIFLRRRRIADIPLSAEEEQRATALIAEDR